jgi:hypothetical protein
VRDIAARIAWMFLAFIAAAVFGLVVYVSVMIGG